MNAWSLVWMMIVVTLSGCIADTPPTQPEGAAEGAAFTYRDDRINITSIDDVTWVPTLDEPPQWKLGQWWKVRLSEDYTGAVIEAYRVVAGQEDEFWLVGMPTHDFANDLMVWHLPGFGQVAKETLGFEAHDLWFDPLQFPLVEDATWETHFAGPNPLTASVMSVDNLTAEIEMTTNNRHVQLTYDATIGAISKLKIDNYAAYEVIDHGDAFHIDVPEYQGQVTVPHMSDLVMYHGRAAGAAAITWGQIGPPAGLADTITVDRTYDRVSFSIILGDVLFATGVPGFYQSAVDAPDGTRYAASVLPTDTQVLMESFKHDAPGGEWTFDNVAGGPGAAFVEGIAYHVYDIELPSGRIMPSVGEHQHGDGAGH